VCNTRRFLSNGLFVALIHQTAHFHKSTTARQLTGLLACVRIAKTKRSLAFIFTLQLQSTGSLLSIYIDILVFKTREFNVFPSPQFSSNAPTNRSKSCECVKHRNCYITPDYGFELTECDYAMAK